MTEQPIIRFVKKEDLPQLIQLCKQHAEFEKSDYDYEGKLLLLKIALFSDVPKLYCLVVEFNNTLIGYTTYMKQFSTWDAHNYVYMDCLYLSDKSRGFGIGEKLIDRIKEEAVSLDCSLIQWQTPEFNKRAMKFYDRIGAKSKNKKRYFLDV